MNLRNIILATIVVLSGSLQLKAQNQMDKYSIKNVSFNSEASDFSALKFGESCLYVSDKTTGFFDLKKYRQTGRSFCDVFSTSEEAEVKSLLVKLNTRFHEGPLSVSPELDEVLFTRNAYYDGDKRYNDDREMKLQIFYLRKEGGKWGDVMDMPFNSDNYSCGHPSISYDGMKLYFVSDMPGGYGGTDIYVADYSKHGWGEPQNLGPAVNSENDELFPFISKANCLYFASVDTVSGHGGLDIFMSKIDSGIFSDRSCLPKPINSIADDFAFTIQKDEAKGDYGFLSSNRTGGMGEDDVYKWKSLVKPLKIRGTVSGTDGNIIAGANLEFSNPGGENYILKTDKNGKYQLKAKRNTKYSIDADHKNYLNDRFELETDVDDLQEYIDFDMVLEDFPVFKIRPITESGDPIAEMQINIQCDGKQEFNGLSSIEGIEWKFPHTYRRGDSISMLIGFAKKGYLNKTIEFNIVIEDGGDIVIPKERLMFVEAREKVEISDFIELDPIYYDFAKWNIRPDAAKELDKVIAFLNNNPDVSVELSSHTDCRGSRKSNMNLSEKRAKSAADYIKDGIDNPDQIYGRGYGESKPINECANCADCTEEEHAENRRTEFTIVGVDTDK